MQVIEKSGDGLSRVYGVKVTAKDLGQKLDARIAEIAPQLSLKGFRPGKVPAAHLRRVYGKSLMGEVIEQVLSETSQEVLDTKKLRVASQPDVRPASDMEKVLAGEADLDFDLNIEVMPDFDPVDPAKLVLERPVHRPSDEDIDQTITDLADRNRTYAPKAGKSAKAAKDDLVVIDFIGRIDGEAFEGGQASDVRLVLGSGQFIPGFEDQLIGVAPGDALTVKVTFPADYQVDALRAKPAEFAVEVKDVQASVEATIDDAFAKQLGMTDLEGLKAAVRNQLEMDYAGASRYRAKRALLDELDKFHDFPLPPRMVEAEFDVIWRQVTADKEAGALEPEDEAKSEDQLRSEYHKIAERRVRLGLVLAEIGRKHNINVTDDELNQAMRAEAMRYRGQEQRVFDQLRQSAAAQAQLRAPVYEDKVVDLLFTLAKVTDKPVSKDELLTDDDLPEGYGEAEAKKPVKAKAKAEKPAAEPKAKAESKPAAEPKAAAASKAKASTEPKAAAAAKAKAPAEPKAAAEKKPAAKPKAAKAKA